MINKIKDFLEELADVPMDIYLWFRWKYRLLMHHLRWIKRITTVHDFVGPDMYKLIYYQLTDAEKAMKTGYVDWTESPECLKSLRIAIKLAKRISFDFHNLKAFDRYYNKWSHVKKEDFMEELRRKRSAEEIADGNFWHESAERWEKRDMKLLHRIIEKYGDGWID